MNDLMRNGFSRKQLMFLLSRELRYCLEVFYLFLARNLLQEKICNFGHNQNLYFFANVPDLQRNL